MCILKLSPQNDQESVGPTIYAGQHSLCDWSVPWLKGLARLKKNGYLVRS